MPWGVNVEKILGIIPSRIGSTRLARKPLADICGKSLIQRTYESCLKSKLVTDLIVATDSSEIFEHVYEFGGVAIMTSEDHRSGTSRIIEVAQNMGDVYSGFLNIQGDHPILEAEHIDSLAEKLIANSNKELVVTPVYNTHNSWDVFNPNSVKVVMDQHMNAMYFSRSPIPYQRDLTQEDWATMGYWKHLGLYGFTQSAISRIPQLELSYLESSESLEQLTWLHQGVKISCVQVSTDVLAVDTFEDLERVKSMLKTQK